MDGACAAALATRKHRGSAFWQRLSRSPDELDTELQDAYDDMRTDSGADLLGRTESKLPPRKAGGSTWLRWPAAALLCALPLWLQLGAPGAGGALALIAENPTNSAAHNAA